MSRREPCRRPVAVDCPRSRGNVPGLTSAPTGAEVHARDVLLGVFDGDLELTAAHDGPLRDPARVGGPLPPVRAPPSQQAGSPGHQGGPAQMSTQPPLRQ